MQRGLSQSAAFVLALLLGACADNPPAVIENKSVPAAIEIPEVRQAIASVSEAAADDNRALQRGPDYIVQPGDTLYAVAFRLGMDYRTLAEINHIDPPYVIRVSESLKTTDVPAEALRGAADNLSRTATNKNITVTPRTESQTPQTVTVRSSEADLQQSVVANPAPPSQTPLTAKPAVTNAPVDRWFWPSSGKVSRAFTDERHKGIDLAGERGAPVVATAPGVVVYAGTGVTGYGALLILKHNDTYLSAYGHNDELLAVEGEQVEAGQLIARMGSTEADSVKLHFEIRRDGRPVNPVGLLPSR